MGDTLLIDKLLQRVLKNKCPICNKKLDKESQVVKYKDAKLEVCKKHVKFKDIYTIIRLD